MLYQLSYYRNDIANLIIVSYLSKNSVDISYGLHNFAVMDTQYFLVVDGASTGPFTLMELLLKPELSPDALVWKTGMSDWKPAKDFYELKSKFEKDPTVPPEVKDFASNPQYRADHSYNDYKHSYDRYDRNVDPRQNSGYHQANDYRDNNDYRYNRPNRPLYHTNWLAWAIVATIAGFFTSCIGAVFGIIGIVQANKANSLYARGYDREGDVANSTAKIMTIIGFILAGIGILVAGWFGLFFHGPGNFSSYWWS